MTHLDTPPKLQNATVGTSTAPTNISAAGKLTLKEAVQDFSTSLALRSDEYKAALPSHISPERFQRVVVTAINLNPALLKANRLSLLNACSKAASDGLLPDGREGALVIFNTKEKDEAGKERYIQKVQWMPMVAGIIKKARQSGEIAVLDAQVVYSEELAQGRFTYKRVDGVPKVDHEPIIVGPRGHPVLVYSVVKFKDGAIDYEVMHADDIAKVRAVSKAGAKGYGPWAEWTEEMWKKSAIRRHAKRLPVSSELFDTIARDDEVTEFERQRNDAERKMLSTAAAQLGAPTGNGGEVLPPIIDGEMSEPDEAGGEVLNQEAADSAEPPFSRGKRLLLACTSAFDVAELHRSIGEELPEDKTSAWDKACAARQDELVLKAKKK